MVCNENLRTGNTLVGEGGQLPGKLVRSKSREWWKAERNACGRPKSGKAMGTEEGAELKPDGWSRKSKRKRQEADGWARGEITEVVIEQIKGIAHYAETIGSHWCFRQENDIILTYEGCSEGNLQEWWSMYYLQQWLIHVL